MSEKAFGNIPEFELSPALDMKSEAGIDDIIAQTTLGMNEKQAIKGLIKAYQDELIVLKLMKGRINDEAAVSLKEKALQKIESDIKVQVSQFQRRLPNVHPNFISRIMQVLLREASLPEEEKK